MNCASFKSSSSILLILAIIIINILYNVNSQAIPTSEYNCINNLFNKVNNAANAKFILNTTYNQYEYCADRAPNTIICNNNKQITSIEFQQTKTYAILSSDLNCFKYLKSFKSRQFIFSKNFFYGPFPNSLEIISLLNTKQFGESFEIDLDYKEKLNNSNSLTRKINNLEIVGGVTTSGTDPKYIYLSSLATFTEIKFTMGNNPISNEYNFYFINDLNENFKSSITYFETYCSNIPSFNYNNKIINAVILTYLPGFNYLSISNFSTYSLVSSIELNAKDETQILPFPMGLENMPSNNNLIYLEINHKIDTPPHFINLSNLDAAVDPYYGYDFYFTNVGPKFNIDGKFPFSSLPHNLIEFSLSGGVFSEFPKLSNIFSKYTRRIYLTNNVFNSGAPEVPITLNIDGLDGLTQLDISGNNIIGTIDESWCQIDTVNFEGNQIGGEAPSCVTCHYNSILGLTWQNINFTNLSPLPKCRTIILNMIYDENTDILLIYGKDIGARTLDTTVVDQYKYWTNCSSVPGFETIKNKQFCLRYKLNQDEPNPFSITINYLKLSQGFRQFQVAAYNKFLPIIDSVIKYSDYFIITGKYFAYNSTVINVSISGYTCDVVSCNFNQIQCYLYSSDKIISKINQNVGSSSDDDDDSTINHSLKLTVKIMDVSSDFNFIPNEICNGTNCPTLDDDCTNGGVYSLKTGTCDCPDGNDSKWFGYTCDDLKTECIESCSNDQDSTSNTGVCNYSNGECIKSKECNTACSNQGECDYDIGKCNCQLSNDQQWIGDYCTIPNHYSNSQTIYNYTYDSTKNPLTIINGWFGNIHSNPSITINNEPCNITQITDTEIQCYKTTTTSSTSSNDQQPQQLIITQNNINWYGIFNPKILNIVYPNSSSSSSNSNSSSSSSNSGSSSTSTSNDDGGDSDSGHKRKIKIALSIVFPVLTVLSISFVIYKFKLYNRFKKNSNNNVELKNVT